MIIYKNGEKSSEGDLVRWYVEGDDDLTTWTLTGLIKIDGVIYLGYGGIIGKSFGEVLTFKEVEVQSINNESSLAGVSKIGTVNDLMKIIKSHNCM